MSRMFACRRSWIFQKMDLNLCCSHEQKTADPPASSQPALNLFVIHRLEHPISCPLFRHQDCYPGCHSRFQLFPSTPPSSAGYEKHDKQSRDWFLHQHGTGLQLVHVGDAVNYHVPVRESTFGGVQSPTASCPCSVIRCSAALRNGPPPTCGLDFDESAPLGFPANYDFRLINLFSRVGGPPLLIFWQKTMHTNRRGHALYKRWNWSRTMLE